MQTYPPTACLLCIGRVWVWMNVSLQWLIHLCCFCSWRSVVLRLLWSLLLAPESKQQPCASANEKNAFVAITLHWHLVPVQTPLILSQWVQLVHSERHSMWEGVGLWMKQRWLWRGRTSHGLPMLRHPRSLIFCYSVCMPCATDTSKVLSDCIPGECSWRERERSL